jgi:putative hemolysin
MIRQTDAHQHVEKCIPEDRGEDVKVNEEIAELEDLYAAPTAAFSEVEEAEDEIIWFVVLVAFLLTLATTVAAAAAVFCWMKGGHLYAWHRISALKVKIGCKF